MQLLHFKLQKKIIQKLPIYNSSVIIQTSTIILHVLFIHATILLICERYLILKYLTTLLGTKKKKKRAKHSLAQTKITYFLRSTFDFVNQ